MDDQDRLAERFEAHRDHLRGVAYRMLGSRAEADDAVQEAWFRLARSDVAAIDNLGGWLTTVVGRICLDGLRARRARAEDVAGPAPGDDAHPGDQGDHGHGARQAPEDEALLADEVGLALLVVLDALGPAERVAFVLHDLFAVPFERIAPIVDRSPVATKKLASRARQRVRGTPAGPAADLAGHRQVVDAFLRAARGGDLRGLVAVLDPDVERRADDVLVASGIAPVLRGAATVAEETAGNAARARFAQAMLVDGRVGVVVAPAGRVRLVMGLTLAGDRIAGIDVIGDPDRLARLELALLDG
jgi:RNA polymerase sigma-70 factor (ECF subfamily)